MRARVGLGYKQTKGNNMGMYYIEMSVEFAGAIEASSEAEAEELAWTSWGTTGGDDIQYNGVNYIKVEVLAEDEEA